MDVVMSHSLIEVICVVLAISVSSQLCEQIAKIRRKIQRIDKSKVLFLDETHKRLSDAATDTIVLPGEPSNIEVADTSSYAARYDMIACCTGKEVLPPIIYAPNERQKGINKRMLHQYIQNLLAQSAGALDRYPLCLIIDRATIHHEEEILQEFHDWGCQELQEVIRMPAAAAKRLSPLDNSLFNVWRQRVLKDGKLTQRNIKQRMSDAWNTITFQDIKPQYDNCGFRRGDDVYFDCPCPSIHQHGR
jgi:hypothetical protein